MIRAGGLGDVATLARLRYEFRAALGRAQEEEQEFVSRCAAWMRARLDPAGAWRCWVAELDGSAIGTVWLQVLEKLPNPVSEPEWHGYVSSLYVRPDHRGRGIGSELLRACLTACDGLGVDAVILWPTPESRSLYLRHGFAAGDDLLQRRAGAGAVR